MIEEPEQDRQPVEAVADVVEAPPVHETLDDEIEDETQPSFDDGPVHRPLIRAQLPRIEGAKLERQGPDFTIRQASGRGNAGFRGAGQGANNGHRFGRGPQRGGRGGANQGFGRGGNQPRHGGGPRKRGR